MHPDDHEKFMEMTNRDVVRDMLSKKNAYYVNFRMIINGVVEYWQLKFVMVGKAPDEREQIVAGFISVDESTRLQLEQKEKLETQAEALKQALSAAQAANNAKKEFLNSMSHEILTTDYNPSSASSAVSSQPILTEVPLTAPLVISIPIVLSLTTFCVGFIYVFFIIMSSILFNYKLNFVEFVHVLK